jgi:exodeoxyribonuclease X
MRKGLNMPIARAVLADVETTGFDEPDVIQLAFSKPFTWAQEITAEDYTVLNFQPGKPITNGAKAAHHIIEADLTDCPRWPGSYPLDADYLIGHNIDFDWKALGSQSGVRRICTLALARLLYEERTDSCALSALMYFLYEDKEARAMAKAAHGAQADLQMNWLLLKEIITDYNTRGPLEQSSRPLLSSFEDLWRLSEEARLPRRMSFGKLGPKDGNPGMLCVDVYRSDPSYYHWLMKDCDIVRDDPYLREALRRGTK